MRHLQVGNCIRFITLPFFMVCAAFGQSDYSISSFSKSVRSIPPAPNQIIQPITGSTLEETSSFPELGSGEVVMRMRFGPDDYRLYHGKFSSTAFGQSNSLSSFSLPAGMYAPNAVLLKFYREKAVNPDLDEAIVYFDNERLYVRFLPSIYFHRDTGWRSIDAVNLTRNEGQSRPLGDLSITSEPSGAKIFIDGEDKGVVTPNYVTDLFIGEHIVRAELKGYQPAEKKVTVRTDSIENVVLTFSSAFGSLQITSDPPGAEVTLNSIPSGLTPLSLSNIKPGQYAIGLSKDLYESIEDHKFVGMNQMVRVDVALKPNFSTLNLPQLPTSAPWLVDSRPADNKTIKVSAGKHQVTWNGGEGYTPIDTIINCQVGMTTTLAITQHRLTGSIKVMPMPMGAEVFINGQSYGTGARVIPNLPTGAYTVTAKKAGYQSAKVEVTVRNNTTESARIMLTEMPAGSIEAPDVNAGQPMAPDVATAQPAPEKIQNAATAGYSNQGVQPGYANQSSNSNQGSAPAAGGTAPVSNSYNNSSSTNYSSTTAGNQSAVWGSKATGVSLGLYGGPGFYYVSGGAAAEGVILVNSSATGISAGLNLDIQPIPYFSIQPGIGYSTRGDAVTGGGLTFQYLAILLDLKLKIPVAPAMSIYGLAGINFGILLGATETSIDTSTGASSTVDLTQYLNSTDFGVEFGGGMEFPTGKITPFVEVVYYSGIANILDIATGNWVSDAVINNKGFEIRAGLKFPL